MKECKADHKLILCYRMDKDIDKLYGLCLYCNEKIAVDLSKYSIGQANYKMNPIYFRDYTKGLNKKP